MHDLPAIDASRLKPCAGCGNPVGPTFWMVQPTRCIVDEQGVRERQGLTLLMGSGGLAEVFAGTPAAREFDQLPEICMCETCALTKPIAPVVLSVEA